MRNEGLLSELLVSSRLTRWFFVALLGAAACCKTGPHLQGGQGKLVAPAQLDFGQVYLGALVQRQVALGNSGTAELLLSVSLTGDPQLALPVGSAVGIQPGASANVAVAAQAQTLGPFAGQLLISGDANAAVDVIGTVIPDLVCPPPGPCLQSQFDPNKGACLEQAADDGQSCDDGNPCTTDKVCSSGLCKGVPISCDDHDVCTTDYCAPGKGCQHLDESGSCASPNDPCQIYFCDPQSGCQSTPASDGTPCQAEIPCIHANVCYGGTCTGVSIPDGTSCIDPRDPCDPNATCKGGACDSLIADALRPGDILWQKVSAVYALGGDGGSVFSDGGEGSSWTGDGGPGENPDAGPAIDGDLGWRAAAAIDKQGNLYLDDIRPGVGGAASSGDFVSLDVCGNERWRVSFASAANNQWTNGRHLLSGGVVISVDVEQNIVGLSESTGATLWTFMPAQTAGLSATQRASFQVRDVALSTAGVLFYTGSWQFTDARGTQQLGRLVGGALRNGQSKFQALLPPVPSADGKYAQQFGYPLMVDENENLYTTLTLGAAQAEIESYDQTGKALFVLPLPLNDGSGQLNSLAENHGLFVEPTSASAFDSEGNLLWSHDDPTIRSNGHSPVIGFDGHITIPRFHLDSQQGVLDNFAADGTLAWETPLATGEESTSSHVLDTANLVYLLTNQERVLAFETGTGALRWSTTLPTRAPPYNGVLGLTPAGSLIASVAERLFSVFAGNPMANAPWPRFRGNNDNTSTPATAAQPQP